uniref:Hyaluronan/mRNA-binding protein domain-containing protein n=1 Tax=Pseudo-nitzschia delicatissima TaxID=44447 RepID=A0A7S0Y828_9STRA|mmetsp:Transcript_3253/g.6756  ORF Transcript_3253/g.6756 Transcript_3253/m.6756 type:complete len:267 (+) Transcript_3253:101-901(+)
MSSNPFAALDDSGDEAPPKKAPVSKKKASVAPSKPDPKSKPNNNNDRNTKHGRGGRPPARDGKRTYDRRSGTGRGKEIKKGGGGARNWGSDKNEAKKAEGTINEDNVIAPVAETEEAEAPAVEEPKEEDNTMTYSEYIASKGKKDEVALRETKNEFAGVTIAAKAEEEAFMLMGTGKKKKEKKQKEAKKTVDVGFRVAKNNTGGEEREGRGDRREGGRGRGRGDRRDGRGRGRGGGRGGRGSGRGPRGPKKPQGLNVQDEGAFPSL